jgi:hypothetical protein
MVCTVCFVEDGNAGEWEGLRRLLGLEWEGERDEGVGVEVDV